jgi:hypothetical protein
MGPTCRCGADVRNFFDHFGCIQCGAACCPACCYELESANYCPRCAQALLELPWAVAMASERRAVAIL